MYIIEGNIGSGKSTLLHIIAKHLPHTTVIQEPVEQWMIDTAKKESLLEKFYTNPSRWSYTMETATMFSRIKEHISTQNTTQRFKIMERSLYSGHYCFAKNGYLKGLMSPLEWKVYTEIFSFLLQKKCVLPRGFIYVYTPPEICFSRSQKRARKGEEIIPLTYFKEIHQQHELYLKEKKDIADQLKDIPVLTINASLEFEHDIELQKQHCRDIETFLLQTSS